MAVAVLAAAAGLLLVLALRAGLADRIVSRYGTRGWCSSTSTPKRRFSRSTATSTCICESPASELLARLLVAAENEGRILLGQAPERLRHLLLLALRLRRDREAHHRLGEVEARQLDVDLLVERAGRRSSSSLSFATAPMSPSPNASAWACSLPCIVSSEPIRSFAVLAGFVSVESEVTVPSRTRKTLISPGERVGDRLEDERRGVGAVDLDQRRPSARGSGTPSTIRSRSAVVPRFFVATAAATGKTSPRVTASFSAVRDLLRRRAPARRGSAPSAPRRSRRRRRAASRGTRRRGRRPRLGSRTRPPSRPPSGLMYALHVQHVDDSGQLVLDADRDVDGDAAVGELGAQAPRARGRSRPARGRAC